MAKNDFTTTELPPKPSFCNGFELTFLDSTRILLPCPIALEVFESQERERAEEQAQRQKKKNPTPPTPFDFHNRTDAGDLACIRAGTEHDLADAQALAAKVFMRKKSNLDSVTLEFSLDLFVAVTLYFVYQEKHCTFPLMLNFLTDKAWESEQQMLCALVNGSAQPAAAAFVKDFYRRASKLGNSESMVLRCAAHWKIALAPTGKLPKIKKPARTVPIFKPEAVSKSLSLVLNMREEYRAGGDVLLQNAQHNEGRRTVPDARKAVDKLEAAKASFENLVEPIARLQTDLILASAMPPEDFHVTPILLLGDPGIGKTFLAMQLADALGVSTDKISAGGAQGGFQLTGSHTSWHTARPGSLFTLLAEGKSAAPVLVIDEVDKITNSQYPVLPVLLDLFEPDTAANFKDEFFEMQFDASRVIFILTANSLEGVPAPLLSRLEVFDVPRPEPEQRLRIIQAEAAQLRQKTKTMIELDMSAAEQLADRVDVDLRKTTRLVKEAFSKAMVAKATIARFDMPKKEGRRSIGFGC